MQSAVNYTFRGFTIPAHMGERLDAWILRGELPGDFLQAVLRNDLTETVGRADATNLANLPAYVGYLYNEAPALCHGSPERVSEWPGRKRGEFPERLRRERVMSAAQHTPGPLTALLAAVRPMVAMTHAEALEKEHHGMRFMYCQCDVLNPCWDNRSEDVPGKHWGGGDACPECTLRAAIAMAGGAS